MFLKNIKRKNEKEVVVLARTGRPKKPESIYRTVRLRFSMVENQMLSIIDSLKDERDKKLAKEILEQLKPLERRAAGYIGLKEDVKKSLGWGVSDFISSLKLGPHPFFLSEKKRGLLLNNYLCNY